MKFIERYILIFNIILKIYIVYRKKGNANLEEKLIRNKSFKVLLDSNSNQNV